MYYLFDRLDRKVLDFEEPVLRNVLDLRDALIAYDSKHSTVFKDRYIVLVKKDIILPEAKECIH